MLGASLDLIGRNVGIYLTTRIALQVTVSLKAFQLILPRTRGTAMSSFAALCAGSTATVGTGNTIGVATAIKVGGPGALFDVDGGLLWDGDQVCRRLAGSNVLRMQMEL